MKPTFEEFVLSHIDNPEFKQEPFCPFVCGGYCDVREKGACYSCEYAQLDYATRKFEE